ncbi:MAG TPA: HYR domain-containing protein, partial [Planctomycetota bacterium]|nr:HYR domain-containing protein [Planctomycetota bacterium]
SAAGTAVTFACTAADLCDAAPAVVATPASGSTFPLGTTKVTVRATDASGNWVESFFDIVVVDTTPPTLTPPPDKTVEQTSPAGTPVDIGAATVSDICDIAAAATNDAPALFPVGLTTVTWQATDASGNRATAVQRIHVMDTTPPVVTVVSPNGGEQIRGGSASEIRWVTTDLNKDTVTIEWTTDDGAWAVIATGVPDTGAYPWDPVPGIDSGSCRIRVTARDTGGLTGSDVSDADFTVDSTPPEVAVASVKQGGIELLAGLAAGRGTVAIQVTASDALTGIGAPPAVTLTFADASTAAASYVGEAPAGTFNYAYTLTGATPNGVCLVDAHAADGVGNAGAAVPKQFLVNVTVLTAVVQLEGYKGSPGALLPLRFVFTNDAGTALGTCDVPVAFTNGRDTESVAIEFVPAGATRVSCKEIRHFLRRRVAIAGTGSDLTAAFTGTAMLLGGDYNNDNLVEATDFSQFLRDFSRTDRPESDINGDGVVDILEFGYIRNHYFTSGDPQ